MRAANKIPAILFGFAAALCGCRQAPADHNVVIDNQATAPADIEALPPDESAATPSNELANGDDEAANVGQQTNSD